MAYKFQIGKAAVSGNIELQPDFDLIVQKDSVSDLGTSAKRFANAYVDAYYGDGSNLTGISSDSVDVTGSATDAALMLVGAQTASANGVPLAVPTSDGSTNPSNALLTFKPSTGLLSGSGAINANSLSLNGAAAISNQGAVTGVTTLAMGGALSGVTTVGASGLASLDGGINTNDDFTVDTDGNVVGVAGTFSGLASLDGGINVNDTLTVSTAGAVAGATTITGSGQISGEKLVIQDGATIGIASDADLLTLAAQSITVAADSSITYGGTAITSTGAELNLVDGSSAGTVVNSKAVIYSAAGVVQGTDFKGPDGFDIGNASVTDFIKLNAAEVVFKDGNYTVDIASHDGTNGLKLGGVLVDASAADLNFTNVAAAGTAEASKAVVLDASKDITGINELTASYFSGDGSGITNINVENLDAAGSDTQVQFNQNGEFAAAAGFTFDGTGSVATSVLLSSADLKATNLISGRLPLVSTAGLLADVARIGYSTSRAAEYGGRDGLIVSSSASGSAYMLEGYFSAYDTDDDLIWDLSSTQMRSRVDVHISGASNVGLTVDSEMDGGASIIGVGHIGVGSSGTFEAMMFSTGVVSGSDAGKFESLQIDSTEVISSARAGSLSSLAVDDLTDGRVLLAGASGEVEDSSKLTFNAGSGALSVAGAVSGSGFANFGGDVVIGTGSYYYGDGSKLSNVSADLVDVTSSAANLSYKLAFTQDLNTGVDLGGNAGLTYNPTAFNNGYGGLMVSSSASGSSFVGDAMLYLTQNDDTDLFVVNAQQGVVIGDDVASITTAGVFQGASVDVSGKVDAEYGFDVNGTNIVDENRNMSNLGSIAGASVDMSGKVDGATGFDVNGTNIVDSSRNIVNIGSITATSVDLSGDSTLGGSLTLDKGTEQGIVSTAQNLTLRIADDKTGTNGSFLIWKSPGNDFMKFDTRYDVVEVKQDFSASCSNVFLGSGASAAVNVVGRLDIGSGVRYDSVAVKTTTATLDNQDSYVICQGGGSAFTVSLPASPTNGEFFAIKRASTMSADLTISGNGNNIDGQSTIILESAGAAVSLVYDSTGDQWNVF